MILPERTVLFARRAARLRRLAEGHALGDYLRFLASLAEAQQAALDAFPEVPLPTERDLALARGHGLPPLSAGSWPRAHAWRSALRQILGRAREQSGLPGAARLAIDRLGTLEESALEGVAGRLLATDLEAVEPAYAPLVAAALQVYWVHLTTALGAGAFPRIEPPSLCPACGSRPLASVVLSGGETHGLRHLVCPLCASQWHLVRAKCVACDSAKDLAYFALEPEDPDPLHPPAAADAGAPPPAADARSRQREAARRRPAVQAEACDGCRTYLKIFHVERDPGLEPTADDLATVALDLQMTEAGYNRFGANPLLSLHSSG